MRSERSFRAIAIWTALALAIAVPLAAAAASPLLAYRQPIYIAAGFAGILALALMLVQPLLVGGYLPGLSARQARAAHRWGGALLVTCVAVHLAGLALTSPPDVVDALLFASPTPFSAWGVIALWAVLAVALLAVLRTRARIVRKVWRTAHGALAAVIVVASVVHAVLIEGTMETMSKVVLCALVVLASIKVMIDLKLWKRRTLAR